MTLRVGVASQTPYVRMKRSLEELLAERPDLDDPVPLRELRRGVDYSVTPGGVARMVAGLVEATSGLEGEWVTLTNGFPRDLALAGFRLTSTNLPESDRAAYGRAKEVVWEAINGLPPQVPDPLRDAELAAAYGSWAQANAQALLARHRAEPFDVLYVNDWQHLPQGRLLREAPRVMHFHAPFAEWTPPGWKRLLIDHLASFDAAIVSTRAWAQALRDAGFDRPLAQVYPWIDPSDFPAPSQGSVREFDAVARLRPDDRVVLNVGRMDPVKGQDVLIAAFARVAPRHPSARLVLVGNGSFSSSKKGGIGLSKGAKWRAHLEGVARELGVFDRIVFTGHLPHRLVLPALHRAEVFAFPSVGEGFGLAVAEAWLARKPALVSDATGVAELVEDGVNGLVFRSRDVDACAAALDRMLSRPEEAAKMGEAGRVTALGTCDVRRRADEIVSILRAVAEGRPREVAEAGA